MMWKRTLAIAVMLGLPTGAVAQSDDTLEALSALGYVSIAQGGFLGVYLDEDGTATNGVSISGVVEGAAAEKAGLQGGDRIVKLGDHDVATADDLREALDHYSPGDKVAITYVRGDDRHRTKATLGAREEELEEMIEEEIVQLEEMIEDPVIEILEEPIITDLEIVDFAEPVGGMVLRSVDGGNGYLGVSIEEADGGVGVTQVMDGTAAAQGGLKAGDVITSLNGEAMTDLDQLVRTVSSLKAGTQVVIELRRGDEKIHTVTTLGARELTATPDEVQGFLVPTIAVEAPATGAWTLRGTDDAMAGMKKKIEAMAKEIDKVKAENMKLKEALKIRGRTPATPSTGATSFGVSRSVAEWVAEEDEDGDAMIVVQGAQGEPQRVRLRRAAGGSGAGGATGPATGFAIRRGGMGGGMGGGGVIHVIEEEDEEENEGVHGVIRIQTGDEVQEIDLSEALEGHFQNIDVQVDESGMGHAFVVRDGDHTALLEGLKFNVEVDVDDFKALEGFEGHPGMGVFFNRGDDDCECDCCDHDDDEGDEDEDETHVFRWSTQVGGDHDDDSNGRRRTIRRRITSPSGQWREIRSMRSSGKDDCEICEGPCEDPCEGEDCEECNGQGGDRPQVRRIIQRLRSSGSDQGLGGNVRVLRLNSGDESAMHVIRLGGDDPHVQHAIGFDSGSASHGGASHGSNPHGSNPHGSNPHGSNPHGSNPHGNASAHGIWVIDGNAHGSIQMPANLKALHGLSSGSAPSIHSLPGSGSNVLFVPGMSKAMGDNDGCCCCCKGTNAATKSDCCDAPAAPAAANECPATGDCQATSVAPAATNDCCESLAAPAATITLDCDDAGECSATAPAPAAQVIECDAAIDLALPAATLKVESCCDEATPATKVKVESCTSETVPASQAKTGSCCSEAAPVKAAPAKKAIN